jgi:hypothetical protein
MAKRSSGGRIEPALRLAILVRILGGASNLDTQLIFHCGRSTIYSVFYDTIDAIFRTLRMPGVPAEGAEAMRNLANGFHTSRRTPNPLWGCIGALDGIAIAVRSRWTDIFFVIIGPVRAFAQFQFRLSAIPPTDVYICLRDASGRRTTR